MTRQPAAWLHQQHPTAYVITDRVKSLWLGCSPDHVENYTIPLYVAPAPFVPTHRHEDGGLYRLVTGSKYKTSGGAAWSDCVIYEAAEDGNLYVTTPARWEERFTPIGKPDEVTK